MELEIPCYALTSTGVVMSHEVDCSLTATNGSNTWGLMIPCDMATTIIESSVNSGGINYIVGDILTVVQGTNTTATVTVTSVDGSGAVTGYTFIDSGSGYTVEIGLPTTGGTGTGATVDIETVSSFTQIVVGACISAEQRVRMNITVGGVDVTDYLVGTIQITHNLNYISSFSFNVNNPDYSPLINSNIESDATVVITTIINGQTFKMLTGLVDQIRVSSDKGYRINITGRDYGKKLLNKTMTLISVQEAADQHRVGIGWIAALDKFVNSTYITNRSDIIKYMAKQADITDIDFPGGEPVTGFFHIGGQLIPYTIGYPGDEVSIDHSFQDQSLWDMIQKECVIQGWHVRFDEDGKMICKTKSLKTVADWTYGENKFTQLGLLSTDQNIINKVIILGAIFEESVITQDEAETYEEIEESEPEYSEDSTSFSETVTKINKPAYDFWSDASFKVVCRFVSSDVYSSSFILGITTATYYTFNIKKVTIDTYNITNTEWNISGGAIITSSSKTSCRIKRDCILFDGEQAFTISATIKWKEQIGGGIEEIEEDNPEETFTETITYEQVKATVTDTNSIAEYGERKPNNEGTLNYPLAETEAQCKRIGENIILDSHRFIQQPDFRIPFNPMMVIGNTVQLTDSKIGYSADKYLVEEIVHYINIEDKGIKARTRIGCVYYT